jgi:starch phosphorylase
MTEFSLEQQAEELIQHIKHYLMTELGRQLHEASDEEVYHGLAYALREKIMVHLMSTSQTIMKQKKRIIYYLSLEYLLGRFMTTNLQNLHSIEVVQLTMSKIGRDYRKIIWCEHDPGLGNGGLGRLAACFLDSLATLSYPAMGYGLRYQYGIFEQQVWDGKQIERPDCWLLENNPWEYRRDNRAVNVEFGGRAGISRNGAGETVYDLFDHEEVRALPYDLPIIGYQPTRPFNALSLRLWSTKESPRNFQLQRYNMGDISQASENTMLTDVLYPNDNHDLGKRIRLKQEFLLVSASLKDLIRRHMNYYPDIELLADKVRIQINDTHPALAVAEMVHLLTKNHNLTFSKAWEITRSCVSYTNHTVLKEALEEWKQWMMHQLLPRQYHWIERINMNLCAEIRRTYPGDEERVRRMSILENDSVRMANLSIYGSHHVNGVAALHTQIIKNDVFKDFFELSPEKFINVTNGVTHRRWLLAANPHLAQLITQCIGPEWIVDFSKMKKLAEHAHKAEVQAQFLKIKRENKEKLIQHLAKACPIRTKDGQPNNQPLELDPNALFDVQVKRIHEYKRQLLNAINAIMIYQDLLANPDSRKVKRVIVIGGKAAPGYYMAKNIIRLIHCIGRKVNQDPRIQGKLKVIFIENYNVSNAEVIIPAAELSEQISTAGLEASGTGNMKFSMNGALTIGTDDGANVEMRQEVTDQWWPFLFGASSHEIDTLRSQRSHNPREIISNCPKIRGALEALRDHTFALDDEEHQAFSQIYSALLDGNGSAPDKYFLLKDLPEYYQTQLKVEELYTDQNRWAQYALHNIAGMAYFSTDRSIHDYAKNIWKLEETPVDPEVLHQMEFTYMAAEQSICQLPPTPKDAKSCCCRPKISTSNCCRHHP